jgi:hypothetical protein
MPTSSAIGPPRSLRAGHRARFREGNAGDAEICDLDDESAFECRRNKEILRFQIPVKAANPVDALESLQRVAQSDGHMAPRPALVHPSPERSMFAVLENNVRWFMLEIVIEQIDDVPIVELTVQHARFTLETDARIGIQAEELLHRDVPARRLVESKVDAAEGPCEIS